jgi:hypothetical protein
LVVEVEAVAEPGCAGEAENACVVYDVVGHVATPDLGGEDGMVSVVSHVAVAAVAAVAAIVDDYVNDEQAERLETPSSYVQLLH